MSGDTVKIIGKLVDTNGPPPEITITLSSILAPRLKGGVSDEPFAWESREFLRDLCIGKRVNFRIIQVVNAINRTFGEVFMCTDGPELLNLQQAAVEAGWATVKQSAGSVVAPGDPLFCLLEAETNAKSAKIGMHTGKPSALPTVNTAPTQADVDVIHRKYKNKPTPAIIEYVRDGSSLRILLLDCWTYVSVSITGLILRGLIVPVREPPANRALSLLLSRLGFSLKCEF
jgi:staphylococcal nuclease domain-containing protein 1